MRHEKTDAKSIFLEAMEHVCPDERADYLDDVCHHNGPLRKQVEALIRAYSEPNSMFDGEGIVGVTDDETRNATETQIGPYTIREQIGEGGMGVVYVAEQTEPVQRKVAIKIIKPGMDTKEVIARFEAERQALAFMEHPNIARVLDAGATDSGRPYFVMELVRGIPITEYCDQVKLSPRERLKLFGTVCDAVQHAHQKGIIHRDIKPSNVLVTQVGAKPVVKVIDFGLAKATSGQRLTDKTLYTGFMKLMGTPAYMSPEQAGLSGVDIDTRSDIYSLGVLLYELLTGTTPLDKTQIQKQAYEDLCRQIREIDAPKPSTRFSTLNDAERSTVAESRKIEPHGLRQLLDGDLDRVVLKAIEKDRDRRYGSPYELAADVERFLQDKPVLAVPPNQWYLARKYMRRHKVVILTAAIILGVLMLATVFSTWQAIIARAASRESQAQSSAAQISERSALDAKNQALAEKQRANDAKQEAILFREKADQSSEERRRLLYAANMQLADQLWHSQSGTPVQIQKLLTEWIPTDDQADLRDLAWRYQWTRLHHSADQTVTGTLAATISPRGNLVIANANGIQEWDEATDSFSQRWARPVDETDVKQVSLSPCGRWAAVPKDSSIRLVDIEQGVVIREVSGTEATFSCSGDCVLVRRRDPKQFQWLDHEVWNLVTREPLPKRHLNQPVTHTLAISSDGRSFFFARPPGYLTVFLADQPKPWEQKDYLQVFSSAWSPNGKLIASGHYSGTLRIHLVDDLNESIVVNTQRDWIKSLRFSNDSRQLVVGGDGGTVDFYDLSPVYRSLSERNAIRRAEESQRGSHSVEMIDPPKLVESMKVHVNDVVSVSFAQDGSSMVTRDSSGTASFWRLHEDSDLLPRLNPDDFPLAGRVGLELEADAAGMHITNVIPKDHRLVAGEIDRGDRIISITDSSGQLEVEKLTGDFRARREIVWLSLAGAADSIVTLQLASSESRPRMVQLQRKLRSWPPNHHGIALTNNGVIVGCASGVINRTTDGTVDQIYPAKGRILAIHPDRRMVAMSGVGYIDFWNLQKDQRLDRLVTGDDHVAAIFSPDGKYFATSTGSPRLNTAPRNSHLRVWQTESLREVGNPLAVGSRVFSGIDFTPDSAFMVATDHGGKIRIWSTSTWQLERELEGLSQAFAVTISPDNKWIAQGGRQGIVIWDLESQSKEHVLPEYNVTEMVFSNDAKTLIATGQGGTVVWLDVATGLQLASMPLESGLLVDCDIMPDGTSLAVLSLNGDIWLQDVEAISRIDRHPFTFAALSRREYEQQRAQQFLAAEQTLTQLLRLQLNLPGVQQRDIWATRRALERSLLRNERFPSIVAQPRSQCVAKGHPVTLRVEVDTAANKLGRYQWFFEGEAIQGANDPLLVIPRVDEKQFGRYCVRFGFGATDLEMFVTSDVATIRDAAKPAGFERGLKKELFTNVKGGDVEDLEMSPKYPHLPDEVNSIDAFELQPNSADNYGVRISGFIVPPTTGEYVFYLCSDDASEIYLSADESQDNQRLIASSNVANAHRAWEELKSESISQPIHLQAGQRYWVEALFKEALGADRFAVTWQKPDAPPPKNGDPPIPGEFLEHLLE